jgi:hypothetical protein
VVSSPASTSRVSRIRPVRGRPTRTAAPASWRAGSRMTCSTACRTSGRSPRTST